MDVPNALMRPPDSVPHLSSTTALTNSHHTQDNHDLALRLEDPIVIEGEEDADGEIDEDENNQENIDDYDFIVKDLTGGKSDLKLCDTSNNQRACSEVNTSNNWLTNTLNN
ncbi:uncharacterized protein MELLADRAFT_112819 [Melampsora larici-populina 98AG31]|uniref:Uncharacterized protein n=1 Tax=Melampsora larici-populina (strain 98AG31 / pathotype 3-4-7) TaxID=747676 RepID=F4S7S7_MELLP|nr:uncharacterized protein MELLADRAFT_112819 [Melampsora larici-populina 98AG31]EGF99262.1 hypothetical protein MELLADRAFT_112819 [Melampsora larici-populina 98AG31]